MEKLELLSCVEAFASLRPSDLGLLAEHASIYDVPRGATIYGTGTADRELFVVDCGEVRVFSRAEDGREIDLARFVSGESFGERDFLSEKPRTESATAECRSRVLVFPARSTTVDAIMMDHPRLFARVLRQFLVVVAGWIRSKDGLAGAQTSWARDLRRRAHRDGPTGLLSRTYLADELGGLLSRACETTGLLIIKPDDFRLFNDSFGPGTGDRALRILADHLRSVLREDDVAARFRAHELAVVMPGQAVDRILARADELRRRMKEVDLSTVTGDAGVPPGFGVGVSIYPVHAFDPEALLGGAHRAAVAACEAGGDRVLTADGQV